MPGLVPGIHERPGCCKNEDGRDEPGHDAERDAAYPNFQLLVSTTRSMKARTLADSNREVG
jgi:hypothetical protein